MKTLKITLLLALFLTISSQTKLPSKKEINKQDTKARYDLFVHSREGTRIPTQG